jgi:hypothetical protein
VLPACGRNPRRLELTVDSCRFDLVCMCRANSVEEEDSPGGPFLCQSRALHDTTLQWGKPGSKPRARKLGAGDSRTGARVFSTPRRQGTAEIRIQSVIATFAEKLRQNAPREDSDGRSGAAAAHRPPFIDFQRA